MFEKLGLSIFEKFDFAYQLVGVKFSLVKHVGIKHLVRTEAFAKFIAKE